MNLDKETLEKQLPLGVGVTVAEVHACGLIALNKPEEILSHPNRSKDEKKSLLTTKFDAKREAFTQLGEDCPYPEVFLLNRIDSATSGLVLIALDERVKAAVTEQFKRSRVEKTYLAIVRGRPPSVPNIWMDVFQKLENGGKSVRGRVGAGNKFAKTRIQWVKSDENQLGLSLLKLIPYTGRTHQLRVQCKQRGVPIIGDKTYGDFSFNRKISKAIDQKRLYLHAHRLELQITLEGNTIRFSAEAPIPDSFQKLLKYEKKLLEISASQLAIARPAHKKRKPSGLQVGRPVKVRRTSSMRRKKA